MMKFGFKNLMVAALCVASMACDSNQVVPSVSNPNLSNPDNNVTTNVGPAEVLITQAVLDKGNTLRGSNLSAVLQSSFGNNENGDSFGTGFLSHSLNIEFDNLPELTDTLDLSESIPCDAGGSRNIIGTATLTLGQDRVSGTVVGSYVIQYSGCKDNAVMNSADGACISTPTIEGEITTVINNSYTLSGVVNDDNTVGDTTVLTTTNTVGVDVTVGNSTDEQTYNFSYSLSSISSNTNLTGTVEYLTELYDIATVESFVGQTSSAVACP